MSVQNLLVTKLAKEKCLEGPAPVSQSRAERPGPAAEKRMHGNLAHVLSSRRIRTQNGAVTHEGAILSDK